MAEQLGQKLRDKRRAMGLTLREVAAQCPTSISHLSEIENGKRRYVGADKLADICRVLQLSVDYVMDDQDDGTVDPEDLEFFEYYQSCSPPRKEMIRQFARLLALSTEKSQ